uniref:Ion transport domain-containing protein n=1 Tax=Chelydra serpentina TaxID=8475 RepID=A0A8C3SZE4_CHESE
MDYLTVPVVSGIQMEKPPYKEEMPIVSQASLHATSASSHPPKIVKGNGVLPGHPIPPTSAHLPHPSSQPPHCPTPLPNKSQREDGAPPAITLSPSCKPPHPQTPHTPPHPQDPAPLPEESQREHGTLPHPKLPTGCTCPLHSPPDTPPPAPAPPPHNYHLSCSFPIMADLWHLCPGKQDPRQGRKWRGTMVLLRLAWERTLPRLLTLRAIIHKFTELLAFEIFILTVVGIHTAVLVAQTFAAVQVRGEWFFSAMDAVFLCVYVLEALLKLIALDLNYFRDPWNDIDFFIMIMMVLDFVLPLLISLGHTTHSNAVSLFRVLRVFKGVRALRVLRLLLTLRSVRHWEVLGSQHCCSLPPRPPVMFSVVLHDLFQNADPQHFGELIDTIFTLFQLFTLDDWSFIYLDSVQGGPMSQLYPTPSSLSLSLSLVIAVLVDNFQLTLIKRQELQKQKSCLSSSDPWEVTVAHPHPNREKQLLFTYLQLMASVEHLQQQFRSQATTTDKIVDSFFETAEQDFPHH